MAEKIITLSNLQEYKYQYDLLMAANYVPFTLADNTHAIALGANNFSVQGVSITAPTSGTSQIAKTSGSGVLLISAGANGDVAFYSQGQTYYLPGASGAVDSNTIATKADVGTVYRFKGSKTVAQLNALTAGQKEVGDVYNVTDAGTLTDGSVVVAAGDNVAWTGSTWDKLGSDLSGYVTTSDLSTALAAYLPLTAGSSNVLTGTLYVKSGNASSPSIQTTPYTGGATPELYFQTYGDLTLESEDGSVVISAGSGKASLSTNLIPSNAPKSFSFPNESGTLVVGTFADNTNDIDALFS